MQIAATEKNTILYEKLRQLPEGLIGEILNGRLYTEPRPSGPHVWTAYALGSELYRPYSKGIDGPGGWWILIEPEIHFIRDVEVVVPDLAGWRRERMPNLPEDQRFMIVPDWVCEILSPSTRSKDRELKMPLYARYGVAYIWLIDPMKKELEAYQNKNNTWKLLERVQGEVRVTLPPFEALELYLADLWLRSNPNHR